MPTSVLPGLDALLANSDPKLRTHLASQRLGLLTNQTGLTKDGKTALQALRGIDFNILALFSPEHGIEGDLEGKIASSTTPDGLPIHSLYGETRRPTPEMIEGLDAILCDLQDVGARFYTYAATIFQIMEACAGTGIAVVVLDRPNPLGGCRIEGPFIDPDLISFVGPAILPITHGLTLGELAGLYKATKKLDVELLVSRVEGWSRDLVWRDLDLVWRRPSPNLPDANSAGWYPGLANLEFSKVSVGRGTEAPFQILASPTLNAQKLIDRLPMLPDIGAQTVEVTPTHATFEGELCQGVKFTACGGVPSHPVAFGLAVMTALRLSHPDFPRPQWDRAAGLLGSKATLELLWNGDYHGALQTSRTDADTFRHQRDPFLIYSSASPCS